MSEGLGCSKILLTYGLFLNKSGLEVITSTLVSGFKISNKNYWILKKNNEFVELVFKQKKLMRRQDNKNFYMPNGAIFISKIKNLNSFYSKKTILYKMKEKESIDIDTIEDLKLARRYIN